MNALTRVSNNRVGKNAPAEPKSAAALALMAGAFLGIHALRAPLSAGPTMAAGAVNAPMCRMPDGPTVPLETTAPLSPSMLDGPVRWRVAPRPGGAELGVTFDSPPLPPGPWSGSGGTRPAAAPDEWLAGSPVESADAAPGPGGPDETSPTPSDRQLPARVQLWVRDRRSRRPVASFRVEARGSDGRPRTTDGFGGQLGLQLPEGSVELHLRAPGALPARLTVQGRATGRAEELVVDLERAATLRGRVTSPRGVGRQGLRVLLTPSAPPGDRGPPREVQTGAHGAFVAGELPPGGYLLEVADGEGARANREVTLGEGESSIELQLR
jgi:hypothetical protein